MGENDQPHQDQKLTLLSGNAIPGQSFIPRERWLPAPVEASSPTMAESSTTQSTPTWPLVATMQCRLRLLAPKLAFSQATTRSSDAPSPTKHLSPSTVGPTMLAP